MADGSGGNVFATCDDVSGLADHSKVIYNTFNAPSAPGIYYITQIMTWWYTCPAPNVGDPPQIPIHNNGPNSAIAVVIVTGSVQNITASTTATVSSPPGTYPITLQGCNTVSPNYEVTLQNGTLTVGGIILGARTGDVETENTKVEVFADKLYPNPASSLVRLQLKDDVHRTSDIQVYDGLGKLNRTSIKKINEKMYDINVSALSKGVYYIKVKTSAGFTTFRFIKM